MARLPRLIAFFSMLSFALAAQSPAQPWTFKHEKSGIKVFYKDEDTGIYDLKLVFSVHASMHALATLLTDVESYTKWVYKTNESWRVRTVSDTEMYYYNSSDFPWPMSDRDVVVRSNISYNPETKTLISASKAVSGQVDLRKDRVRMDVTDTRWHCADKGNGDIEIEYTLKSDPGGVLPDWLVNMALDWGPVETMKNLKKMLNEEKYRNAKASFIKD